MLDILARKRAASEAIASLERAARAQERAAAAEAEAAKAAEAAAAARSGKARLFAEQKRAAEERQARCDCYVSRRDGGFVLVANLALRCTCWVVRCLATSTCSCCFANGTRRSSQTRSPRSGGCQGRRHSETGRFESQLKHNSPPIAASILI